MMCGRSQELYLREDFCSAKDSLTLIHELLWTIAQTLFTLLLRFLLRRREIQAAEQGARETVKATKGEES
jgi:hypothetical protein